MATRVCELGGPASVGNLEAVVPHVVERGVQGEAVEYVSCLWTVAIAAQRAAHHRNVTYTWCVQWWRHRPVAARIAHLHSAFEASRRSQSGGAISAFLSHIDAHMRVILDAANGPLHRCTRAKHAALQSLSADPVPRDGSGPRVDHRIRTAPPVTAKPNPHDSPTAPTS
ncbi:DUF4913 domain-containing protein [Nocardia sp. NPDC059236]